MKQSSIEWLEDKALKGFISPEDFERAKEMHKQEVIDAVEYGNRIGYEQHRLTCILDEDEQYYNETYNIKR